MNSVLYLLINVVCVFTRISGACHELGVDVKGPPTPPLPPPDTLLTTTQAQNHLETTYHQQTHPKNQQRHRLDHLDLHTTTSQTTMTTTSYLQTPGYGHQRHHSDDASYRKDHQYYQYYKHPEAARPQNGEHHNNCSAGYKVLSGQDSLAKKDQLLLLDPTVDKARQLQAPILPTEAPNRKDIPMTSLNLPKRSDQLCPKHSPQLPSKDYKPQPEQTKLSEIISPPVQYSPKSKCKHDLIQFDASFQLPSPPKDDPFAKKPLMTSYPDDTELKLPRKASKKGQPVRNISHCQIGDLPVPPPAQYSPRSSTRRREFDHSSICGLPVPPPPVQLSPKAKHIHWKQGETIATLSIIRPVKPSEGQQTNIDTGLTTKSSLSTSQSRMEKFLSQAVSVQSTLAPIRIPKSSLLGLALHQPPAEAEKHCKPTHQRRYSVHSTEIIETLSHGLDPSKLNTSPSHQKLSCESGTTDSPVKPKRPLSRDVSTDSQDLTLKMEGATKKERILSRDASTDSEDLIKFEEKPPLPPTKSRSRQNSVEIVEPETEPSPKGPTTSPPARPTRATRDPLLKSFSVDESCRLPPFLSPTLFVDINQPVQQYNISAMVSPSKQLQNNLKQGSSHLFLAPRRSWQDIGFHRPSQPNLDVLLASEEAALSPIWLPKQPLEPLRSPKHRRPSKDQSAAKALSRKDNLSPSNSFTRSRRSSHENMADELVHIVTKKDKDESPLGRSNSFNRPKKLLSASRRSSEEQITSPKSPRKRFSPSTSIDRTKSQELIVITSETTIIKKDLLSPTSSFRSRKHSEDSSGTPKPRRKKVSPSQSSQELIYISSASSPTKKTSISPSASVTTLRRPSKESLSSPKSPRKKSVTPSDSLDKMKSGTQELIIISTEAPQVENMASPKSPRRRRKSSKDGVSPSSSFCSSRRSSKEDLASPKSPRKKNLSPSSSFSLSSRRSSREDNNIAVVSISSPTSPRKKSVSPSNSFTRKQFTPIPSRKNSLSPSASFSISRSSPIPIPSPKRSCLSRSNSFNAKSKIFSQTLSIEIPSSPLVLSRSGSINDNLSPPKHQSLLSPALEAALISEITAKLSGVHRSISPQTTKHSRGTSPKSTCIYATISPQKSVEIPECVSPSISGISSQVSIEFPDISPISPLKSFSDTSPYLSLEVPIMLEHSSQATSFDTSTNVSPETIPKIDMQHLQQQQNQVSSVVGLKSPQKSPKMSPIQCPIHVEIHVRLPKDDNDKLIATKCQGTQIP